MRTELTRRIFIACMVVFVLTIGLLGFLTDRYLYREDMQALREETSYFAAIIDANGLGVLPHTPAEANARVTVVDREGVVLYDSSHDPKTLGSHAAREEIREAFLNGTGESSRYSDTAMQKTAYYAVRLRDGGVVRVSRTQDTVLRLAVQMLGPMLLLVVIMVLISIWMAARSSKRIVQPIDAMDVENPDDRGIYDEMKPFVRRLISQNQQIYHQMAALREEHRKQDTIRREFTANVSHELKTPLTSISGFAELIRSGMAKEADIPHFADNIYREAQRLIELVNDILRLSRLEDPDVRQTEREDVELLALCRGVADRLMLAAEQADVTLTCTGTPVTVRATALTLEESVYNVCDNAVKYSRSGGHVDVTVGVEDGMAVVRVKDDGIGIPAADRERVFERFYRVNKSHSKEVGGTGLGLSIVKHAMARLGGTVELHSAFGVGTEVVLRVPIIEKTEKA